MSESPPRKKNKIFSHLVIYLDLIYDEISYRIGKITDFNFFI